MALQHRHAYRQLDHRACREPGSLKKRGSGCLKTAPSEQLVLLVAVKESNYSVKDFLGCSFYISFGPFPKRSGKEPFNRRFVA